VIDAYSIQDNGSVSPLSPATYAAGTDPYGIAMDPNGNYVYVSTFTSGELYAFTRDDADGSLTGISGSPFTIGTMSYGVIVVRLPAE
jgi:DNA-binding beta-propeller fold protein YncE